MNLMLCKKMVGWLSGRRQSLTGELSLVFTGPTADG